MNWPLSWRGLACADPLLSRLCRARIGDRVGIGEGEIEGYEEIRFRWKDSGFVGRIQVSLQRNQVSLEGFRFGRLRCKYGVMVVA